LDNKKKYINFCKNNDEIPLFHQPWWLDIVTNNNWNIALSKDKNDTIKAAMPYSIVKKMGFQFLLQPKLTPQLGILLFYPKDIVKQTSINSFQNKHIGIIIENLPKHIIYHYSKFVPEFDNWYPFFKKGYQQSTRYTYVLENIKDHESIFNGFSNTIKRQIKEAKEYTIIGEEQNLCLVYSLVKESLKRQNTKFVLNRELIKAIENKSEELSNSKILIARDKNNKVVAATFVIWDTKKAYLLGLGTDLSLDKNNSTKLLIWESIKYASKYVDDFDFEGSMLPGVERLYRNFGGKRIPYFEIKKYKNKFHKVLFTLLNK